MDNENELLICKIQQMATCIQNLETTLNDRENENAKLADKMHMGFEMLEAMKTKQNELFYELDDKNKELIHELDELQVKFNTRSLWYQEEIECLQYKLDKQESKSEELETVVSTHLNKIKTLQKQLSCTRKQFHDNQRLLKSELKVKDQDLICIKNTLADKITEYAELEKKLSIEQDRCESLQSSIYEIKIQYEKDFHASQSEISGLRIKLKHNVAKLEEAEHKLQEVQDKIVEETSEFDKAIKKKRDLLCKEKNKFEEKNAKLMDRNKSLVSNMTCINMKLCNSLMENKTLKCQLADQHESIKLLEETKNLLQKEMDSIKENEKLSKNILMEERKNHAREQQVSEKKLELKAQDGLELKELSNKLSERIKCLTKMIHENDTIKV